jgi:outer membrane receptor protein involved in Fe transport
MKKYSSSVNVFVMIILTSFNLLSLNESIPPLNGKIKGVVKDAKALNLIEYANVSLYLKQDSSLVTGTITDADGYFQLNQIPEGEYYLFVDFIGFEQNQIPDLNINRKNKEIDLGVISLSAASYELEEVTVRSQKNYVDFKIDKKVVNVSRHANAAGDSVSEVLENVPSIQVDIEGNITLRGSTSYTVLIDGKPSPVNGADLLKQLPANSVENIEIITNPSAKYDPEGTTGIINIIMKKGYTEGLNGLVNANYATWKKVGGDLNFNYRTKKVNYFLVSDYRRNPRNAVSENMREIKTKNSPLFIDERTNRTRTMRPFRINPGLDFYFNDKNTLSLSATYGGWRMERLFDTRYATYYQDENDKSRSLSNNDFNIDGYYSVANANYQHIFSSSDHKLDVNLSAWRWNSTQKEKSFEQSADINYNALNVLSNKRSDVKEKRNNLNFKTDYSLPLAFGKFELGLDISLINQQGNVLYEEQNLNSEHWNIREEYTYESKFFRNTYAAYTTFGSKVLGLEYQLGLRLEKTDRNVYQLELDQDYPIELFKLYPSFHLTKNFNQKQQIQFSYSRRINRPRPWQLNPYPGYTDSYNYFQGNPLLKPADTDAFELNYIHRFGQLTFSSGLYYRQTFNGQEMVQSITEENPEVVYLTFGNLDKSTALGGEYLFNYMPNQKLNLNLSGNLYHFQVFSSYTGEEEKRESFNWDARLSSSYNFDPNTSIQFSGIYNGPSVNGQGNTKAFYYFDLGLRKRMLNRKLTLSLLAHNVFKNGTYETMVENEDFTSSFYFKGESPVIRLNVSYIINNYQRTRRDNIDIGAGAN